MIRTVQVLSVLSILCLCVAVALGLLPPHQWTRVGTFDNLFLATQLRSFDLDADPAGNVFLVGAFGDSASVIGTELVSAGAADILVAKVAGNGDMVWARRAGGEGSRDEATAVDTDALGHAFVVGVFSGTADFGPHVLVSAGDTDAFVARVDPDGNILWVHAVGGAGPDLAMDVAVDHFGNCLVTGTLDDDVFLAKYDSDGGLLWTLQGIASGGSSGRRLAASVAGGVVLVGVSGGTFSFGDSTLTQSGTFVARVDPSGTVLWTRQGIDGFSPGDIGTDSQGACIVTGRHRGIDFGDVEFTPSSLYFEGYVIKWDADGEFQWADEFQSLDLVSEVEGHRVAVDSSDDVLVSGHFIGQVTVGGTTLGPGAGGAFLARYSGAGAPVCVDPDGGGSETFKLALAVDDADNIFRLTFGESVVVPGRNAFFLGKWGPDPTPTEAWPALRTPRLLANHPNPCNPATTISFELPVRAEIRIALYDVAGRRVTTLVDGVRDAGHHRLLWRGNDDNGRQVASGTYFYRLEVGSFVASRALILLR